MMDQIDGVDYCYNRQRRIFGIPTGKVATVVGGKLKLVEVKNQNSSSCWILQFYPHNTTEGTDEVVKIELDYVFAAKVNGESINYNNNNNNETISSSKKDLASLNRKRNSIIKWSSLSLMVSSPTANNAPGESIPNQRVTITLFGLDLTASQRPVTKPAQPRIWTFSLEDQLGSRQFINNIVQLVSGPWSNLQFCSSSTSLYQSPAASLYQSPDEADSDRRLLILLNPFGGFKKATAIFEKIVRPMLSLAGIQFNLVVTERPRHAYEVAKNMDLKRYCGVVTVSGDGLFHEVLDGLLARESDWAEAIAMPLGIIPAGSGNALAKSIDSPFPEVACLNIIKGSLRKMDMFACRFLKSGRVLFGHLELLWAFMADADLESEQFRWLGPDRAVLQAVIRILWLRSYPGRLYLLRSEDYQKHRNQESSAVSSSTFLQHHSEFVSKTLDGAETKIESIIDDKWQKVESTGFTYFVAMNAPWCATDILSAPQCRINDGMLNLIWIENASRSTMTSLLLDTESGAYIKRNYVRQEHCKAFILDPGRYSDKVEGVLDVDGERVPFEPVLIECLPSIINIMVPKDYDESMWAKNLK